MHMSILTQFAMSDAAAAIIASTAILDPPKDQDFDADNKHGQKQGHPIEEKQRQSIQQTQRQPNEVKEEQKESKDKKQKNKKEKRAHYENGKRMEIFNSYS